MRIEWVRLRLENWALWLADRGGAGLGYPRVTAFAREATCGGQGGYRESVVPVDSVEAGVTNDAVKALEVAHLHLHTTLCCVYIEGIGFTETARRTGKAESTVKGHLAQADAFLAGWFRDRSERARRQAAAVKGGFTS